MDESRQLKEVSNAVSKEPAEQGVIQRLVASYRRAGDADSRVHLRDYLYAVRKHLWLVIGLTLLVTMVAVIYLARQPDIYLAHALVQVDVEDFNPALGANSKNNQVIVNNSANDPAYFNTQLRVLTSYGLLSRVVKTLDLENNKAFTNPRSVQSASTWQNILRMVGLGKKGKEVQSESQTKGKLPVTGSSDSSLAGTSIGDYPAGRTATESSSNSLTSIEDSERYAPLVKTLMEDLQIEPVVERRMGYGRDTTRLIEIRYKHPDPRLAARIVNTIADTLALLNLERKADKSVSTGDFLQKRIAELQMQIRASEERLLNYAKSNEILSLDASQNTVVDRLTGLNRQLLEAENERKLAESAWQAARAPGAARALAEETISKQTADLTTRLAELRQKQSQLLVENTERWPEVREIKQQIATLEQELQTAISRATTVVLSNLETHYRQAQQREQAVRTDFDKQRGATLTQNEAAVNYRIIQQEIETNKGLLNGLLQSYKENDVVLAGLYKNISVFDYAIAPDKPIGPKRWQGILLALLFSLPCGIGLVLLLEYLNDSIRSIDDVEKLLRLPALAAIPAVKSGRSGRSALLLSDKSMPAAAEAYRQLRTAVLLSTPGRAPRTMLVTSSVPGEGKTTSSVNLAISLAQTKAKVLLIDADLRRPRLHTIFGMNNRRGLSSYLSSDMGMDNAIDLIQHHAPGNLHVLTSGPVPPNPAELLGSEQMRRLLKRLESEFTYIVIDSAPSASFTDAVLLSAMVDGLLLVVHCNSTARNLVLRTKHLLSGAGAKIFGVVLSQVVMTSQDAIYGSYLYQTKEKVAGELPSDSMMSSDTTPGMKQTAITTISKNNNLTSTDVESPVNATSIIAEELTSANDSMSGNPASTANGLDHDFHVEAKVNGKLSMPLVDNGGDLIQQPVPEDKSSSGLIGEIVNHLTAADSARSYEAYSLLLLMAKGGASKPLLRLTEESDDIETRLALIKLLGASGDSEALRGLVHLAASKRLQPIELSTALESIERLAGLSRVTLSHDDDSADFEPATVSQLTNARKSTNRAPRKKRSVKETTR